MKKPSKIQSFLAQEGLLNASPENISAAKARYWAKYHIAYKKAHKKTVTLLLSQDEYCKLKTVASNHKRPLATYIRESAVAYAEQRFLTPNTEAVNAIRLLLSNQFFSLRACADPVMASAQSRELLQRFEAMESSLLAQLTKPDSLEEYLQEILTNSPHLQAFVCSLLKL